MNETNRALWEKRIEAMFEPGNTFRDVLEPAIEIARDRNHDAARMWFKGYSEYLSTRMSRAEAEETALSNLGYFAGYYDQEVIDAVHEVFGAVHPLLGHQDRFGRTPSPPTMEEAFAAGVRWGEKMINNPEEAEDGR